MRITLLTRPIEGDIHDLNVGDGFIRYGMQYILEKALAPEPIQWELITRFEKFTPERIEIIKSSDLVIYAGMPQYNNLDDWKFYYDDEIWDDLIAIGKPILRLAGGGGYPSDIWTPQDFANHLNSSQLTKDILQKSLKITSLITTRDKMAQQFLVDNGVESTLLPCTGTFACKNCGIYTTDKRYNAINLTAIYLRDRPDKNEIVEHVKTIKAFIEDHTGKPCLLFAQFPMNDHPFMLDNFGECLCFKTAKDMIEFYSHVDICVTSRLHTALPIHGIGGRCILIRVDTRGIAAEELGIPVIPLSKFNSGDIIDIIKGNNFSKIPMEQTERESIEFYKRYFDSLKQGER